jgi:hypothetical protein
MDTRANEGEKAILRAGRFWEIDGGLLEIASILKSEIVNSVLDWIQQKKSADENKLARELNKNLAKIN